MITVTDSAASKIKELITREKHPEGTGLMFRVVGGGCSGLSYSMGFLAEPGPKDKVLLCNGIRVFSDGRSLIYLAGVTLDYVDGLYGAGFKVENPNAKNTCGCGKSFS